MNHDAANELDQHLHAKVLDHIGNLQVYRNIHKQRASFVPYELETNRQMKLCTAHSC